MNRRSFFCALPPVLPAVLVAKPVASADRVLLRARDVVPGVRALSAHKIIYGDVIITQPLLYRHPVVNQTIYVDSCSDVVSVRHAMAVARQQAVAAASRT